MPSCRNIEVEAHLSRSGLRALRPARL